MENYFQKFNGLRLLLFSNWFLFSLALCPWCLLTLMGFVRLTGLSIGCRADNSIIILAISNFFQFFTGTPKRELRLVLCVHSQQSRIPHRKCPSCPSRAPGHLCRWIIIKNILLNTGVVRAQGDQVGANVHFVAGL